MFTPEPSGGASNTINFTVSDPSNPLPVLTAIAPDRTFAGSRPVVVTLEGSDFVPEGFATFDGAPLATTYVGPNSATAVIPAELIASTGDHQISFFNPEPAGGTSASFAFSVHALTRIARNIGASTGHSCVIQATAPVRCWDRTRGASSGTMIL